MNWCRSDLNILIVMYYSGVNRVMSEYPGERRRLTPVIKEFVNGDLLRIVTFDRQVTRVRSIGDQGSAKTLLGPVDVILAITEKGKRLVEKIDLSSRADACIVELDRQTRRGASCSTHLSTFNFGRHVLRNFVDTLALKDLPEFLSHESQPLRDLSAERLRYCIGSISTEDLPELLVDTDSAVRGAVSAVLSIEGKE